MCEHGLDKFSRRTLFGGLVAALTKAIGGVPKITRYDQIPGGDPLASERNIQAIIARGGTVNELRQAYGLPTVSWGTAKVCEHGIG